MTLFRSSALIAFTLFVVTEANASEWPPQSDLDCASEAFHVDGCYFDCALWYHTQTGNWEESTVLYQRNDLCIPLWPTGRVQDGPSCLYLKDQLLKYCRQDNTRPGIFKWAIKPKYKHFFQSGQVRTLK